MVCGGEEADQVRSQLLARKTGRLMTYQRVEDMVLNSPTGRVALVVLAVEDDPAAKQRTLRWLRHRWPSCPITVGSGAGGVENEMAARQGGAFYLTSGEAERQLPDMVSHALRAQAGDKAGLPARSNGDAECRPSATASDKETPRLDSHPNLTH